MESAARAAGIADPIHDLDLEAARETFAYDNEASSPPHTPHGRSRSQVHSRNMSLSNSMYEGRASTDRIPLPSSIRRSSSRARNTRKKSTDTTARTPTAASVRSLRTTGTSEHRRGRTGSTLTITTTDGYADEGNGSPTPEVPTLPASILQEHNARKQSVVSAEISNAQSASASALAISPLTSTSMGTQSPAAATTSRIEKRLTPSAPLASHPQVYSESQPPIQPLSQPQDNRPQIPTRRSSESSTPADDLANLSDEDEEGPEFAWNPLHPCWPHPNSHVPLTSPLFTSTRIIRIARDWRFSGDMYPQYSILYPEILEPFLPQPMFKELIITINQMCASIFSATSWRSMLDSCIGLATGWISEDLGLTGVKKGMKRLDKYFREWNEREGKRLGVEVVSLRRTAFLAFDIVVPDPSEWVVTDGGVAFGAAAGPGPGAGSETFEVDGTGFEGGFRGAGTGEGTAELPAGFQGNDANGEEEDDDDTIRGRRSRLQSRDANHNDAATVTETNTETGTETETEMDTNEDPEARRRRRQIEEQLDDRSDYYNERTESMRSTGVATSGGDSYHRDRGTGPDVPSIPSRYLN